MLGPDVLITSPGYGCTESVFGVPLNRDDIDVFVVNCPDVVEYVHLVDNQAQGSILQAVRISLRVLAWPVLMIDFPVS